MVPLITSYLKNKQTWKQIQRKKWNCAGFLFVYMYAKHTFLIAPPYQLGELGKGAGKGGGGGGSIREAGGAMGKKQAAEEEMYFK